MIFPDAQPTAVVNTIITASTATIPRNGTIFNRMSAMLVALLKSPFKKTSTPSVTFAIALLKGAYFK
jgi:hypothetical protein